MRQRIITAIVFAAAMLGGIFGGGEAFFILFFLIAAGCSWELAGLLFSNEKHIIFRRSLGVFFGVLPHILLGREFIGLWFDLMLFPVLVLMGFFGALIAELFFASERPFSNAGHYLLCFFYIGVPFALLSDIAVPHEDIATINSYTPFCVFGPLLLIWTNDTMAYFIGSQLGRRKLFERISPKKTWEGTIGGGIFTVLVAWGLSFIIKDFTQTQWLALGVVAAIFGTLGDLVESMLKRSVGVKDSGNLLPGHGGLLDRFDAFIFALPFFWLALQIFKG